MNWVLTFSPAGGENYFIYKEVGLGRSTVGRVKVGGVRGVKDNVCLVFGELRTFGVVSAGKKYYAEEKVKFVLYHRKRTNRVAKRLSCRKGKGTLNRVFRKTWERSARIYGTPM